MDNGIKEIILSLKNQALEGLQSAEKRHNDIKGKVGIFLLSFEDNSLKLSRVGPYKSIRFNMEKKQNDLIAESNSSSITSYLNRNAP